MQMCWKGRALFVITVQLLSTARYCLQSLCVNLDREAHWKAIALYDPLSVVLCYIAYCTTKCGTTQLMAPAKYPAWGAWFHNVLIHGTYKRI
jgi:hypothetical protein